MINKILLLILSFVMVVACNKSPLIESSTFDESHRPLLEVPGSFVAESTPGNGQIALTWTDSALANSYSVKYRLSTDSTFTTASTSATSPYVITGLVNSSAYVIKVTAINEVGETDSNELNDTPVGASGLSLTINQAGAQANAANSLPIEFDVVFNQAIDPSTFTTADITQNGTAGGITWAIINSGNNISFTLRATLIVSEGTVIPTIAASTVQTADATDNTVSTSTDNTVTYDATVPTVTVNQGGAQVDPATALPVVFDVVFSEPIDPATFSTADITQNGTATGITWTLTNSGNNQTYTLRATAITGSGTVIPSIAASAVQDLAANNNTVSTTTDNSVTWDGIAPSVTVNQGASQVDPINALPIEFDVVFSEPIVPATFTTADITQNGTATGITWTITHVSANTTFTLRATVITGAGTVRPSIAAATVTDVAGNSNTVSTATDNTVTYDITAPTVTVNQGGSQVDPINALPIVFDIVFSEPIVPATFTTADITQNGTATGITWTITHVSNNTTFTLSATAITGAGTVRPSIAVSRVTDVAGNDNAVSTTTDNTVTYDATAPSVTVNHGSQADPAGSLPILFDVVFSEPITAATFTTADITQNGTATGITWTITNSGDNFNFVLRATAITGVGTVIPSIAASSVTDPSGNNNTVSTATDNTVTYTLSPVVTVNQATTQPDPDNTVPIEFRVVFNKVIDPTTFTTADITQNGTATVTTWTLTNSGDDMNFTLKATAISAVGTVIPSIAAGAVLDASLNGNLVSTSTDNTVTYVAPSMGWVHVSAAFDGGCGLTVDGKIYCWGLGTGGQIGDSAGTTSLIPTPVDTTNLAAGEKFVHLSTGNTHACAITSIGKVYCWGRGSQGQLGNNGTPFALVLPTIIDTTNLAANEKFIKLETGVSNTFGLTNLGNMYGWGINTNGALGDNTNVQKNRATALSTVSLAANEKFNSIETAQNGACASSTLGKVYCWGAGNSRIGDALGATIFYPTPIYMTTIGVNVMFTDTAVGTGHACGLSSIGEIHCWGSDLQGKLGVNTTTNSGNYPSTTVVKTNLASSERFTSVDSTNASYTCSLSSEGNVYCWGADTNGTLGENSSATEKLLPTPVITTNLASNEKFIQIDVGPKFSCGLTSSANVYCWGAGTNGQIGDNSNNNALIPKAIVTTNLTIMEKFKTLTLGGHHTCGQTTAGWTYCWGLNDSGQLGDDSTTDRPRPRAIVRTNLAAVDKFKVLTSGTSHTCGITTTAKTFCWGLNTNGQLGDNTNTVKDIPTAIVLTNLTNEKFKILAAGDNHTCGITSSGNTFCWGLNSSGQLGDNTTTQRDLPTAVDITNLSNENFISLVAGSNHTCGITGKGNTFCWGLNTNGQVGDSTNGTNRLRPTAVTLTNLTDETFTSLTAGSNHTCGITGKGNSFCWGLNTNGQIGDNGTTQRDLPTALDITNLTSETFINLTAGGSHTCGITSAGNTFCWGLNTNGQLGDNTNSTDRLRPKAIDVSNLASHKLISIEAGLSHTCGISAVGNTFCWGLNADGQVGDNGTTQRDLPTAVDTTDF